MIAEELIQPCRLQLKRKAIESDSETCANLLLHECKRCASQFDDELQLKAHVLSNCPEDDEAPLDKKVKSKPRKKSKTSVSDIYQKGQCTECGKTFVARTLGFHMRQAHNMYVRCRRWLCSTYFSTEAERQLHEDQVHSGGREKRCIYCRKIFSNNQTLQLHMVHYHVKEAIQCNFSKLCTEYFHTIAEKDKHIRRVHNLKSQRTRSQRHINRDHVLAASK